jgi:dTDP-4-dehydrorhamnose 3,5-epimerase
MYLKLIPTTIQDLIFVEMPVHSDIRGFFTETYNYQIFADAGISTRFCQDNLSLSANNVLRGLHFQRPPFAQAKLVRVIKGRILDVVVDIRKQSATFGKHIVYEMTSDNRQLFIPEGFAHGFLSLEDDTMVSYKCSNYYQKGSEDGLPWNDESLNIDWGINAPLLSAKDNNYLNFRNFNSPF